MDFQSFIIDQALILIPVLYVLGVILKGLEFIKDKYIPLILLSLGIALSLFVVGLNIQAVIQGTLVTGATVLANQMGKQLKGE